MSFLKEASTAIRFTIVFWVITAVIYPLVTLVIGQIAFPLQANGSLVSLGQPDKYVGSYLIGQNFTSERYFWGRPSASSNTTSPTITVSNGSNLAPSNPELAQRIKSKIEQLSQVKTTPTADLIYASGSGLDPQISPEAASAQIERIARARSLPVEKIQSLIDRVTRRRLLGIFGENRVNVLELNIALDNLKA